MTPEELSSCLDFTPSIKWDFPLLSPIFSLAVSNQVEKALLDPQVREDWGGHPVWHVCGDHNAPVIQSLPWVLEDKIKSTDMGFRLIKDANHFVSWFFIYHALNLVLKYRTIQLMWEEPDRFLAVMKEYLA